MRQRKHQKLAFGERQEIVEPQKAFAFERPLAALAFGKQLAQPAVRGTIARIDQDVRRAVDEDDPGSDQKPRLVFYVWIIELLESPHDAGERVVVGDADDRKAKFCRLVDIGLRMRAAAQERKIRGDADFRVIHANNPCMNQFGGTALPSLRATSSNNPSR